MQCICHIKSDPYKHTCTLHTRIYVTLQMFTFKNIPMFCPVSPEHVKDETFIVQAPKCVEVPLLPVVLLNIFERDNKMCDMRRVYRRANLLGIPHFPLNLVV